MTSQSVVLSVSKSHLCRIPVSGTYISFLSRLAQISMNFASMLAGCLQHSVCVNTGENHEYAREADAGPQADGTDHITPYQCIVPSSALCVGRSAPCCMCRNSAYISGTQLHSSFQHGHDIKHILCVENYLRHRRFV